MKTASVIKILAMVILAMAIVIVYKTNILYSLSGGNDNENSAAIEAQTTRKLSFRWESSVETKNTPSRENALPMNYMISNRGVTMNVNSALMDRLSIPLQNFTVLDDRTVTEFVFVTGASSNHFRESMDAIGGVQKNMAGYRIYYYDLGLKSNQRTSVKTLCDVIYRKFEYRRYPNHVKNLNIYAFKPLIIQEMLQQHQAVVWMDASFRLLKNFSSVYSQIIETGGFLQFWHSPSTNYAVTDPRMYNYIPTQIDKQMEVWSRAAGAVCWYRTEKVYWGILYWWVLCALDKDCIAPNGASLHCNFQDANHSTKYAHCHRFDMSALNLLASNLYDYNQDVYTARDQGVVKIVKHASEMFKVKTC